MADTDKVGIFQGLQANAMGVLEDYHEVHDEFENKVSDVLAWHGLSDPLMSIPMTHRLPGGELVQVVFTPSQRKGEHIHFRHKIVSRSTGRVDPNTRFQRMLALLDAILKAAEVSMATGGLIDVAGVARIGGQMLDIRQIQQIVRDYMLQQELMARAQTTPPASRGQIAGQTEGLNPQSVSYQYRTNSAAGGLGGSGGAPQSAGARPGRGAGRGAARRPAPTGA